MTKPRELVGEKFGRLTVVKRGKNNKYGQTRWHCVCECGNEKIITGNSLISGNTQSCGCLNKELISKRNLTHGLSKDKNGNKIRLYNIWIRMKQRCININCNDYKDYGDRGVSVCDEWMQDFESFYIWSMSNGYKENLSIDRKDVNGNYEPNNCRWVSQKTQARNKRNNHFINYNGESKTLSEWSEILGMDSGTLRMRLKNGWETSKAFNTPVKGM